MKQQAFKGEITVFLSLVFVLLVSLVASMIQSASIHINKSMKRADTELALESVFAEYHVKMLEEYQIFAKEGRDEKMISKRLWFYGADNVEHEISKIQLLTDGGGQAFYRQAIQAMGGEAKEIADVQEHTYEQEENRITAELDKVLQEEEQTLPAEDNPLAFVEGLKQKSLLSLVLLNPETISNRYVKLEALPSHRALKKGAENSGGFKGGGITERLQFIAYLTEHFPSYTEESKERALFYEAEYLLGGHAGDKENLEAVAKKLLHLRMAVNYTYLLTDSMKQGEAEAMAVGLCSLLTVPAATELVKQALLFAWAYGESILDLRVLFRGKAVAPVKTNETWQLQLASLSKLGTPDEIKEEREAERGLSYENYISMLLFAEKEETLCMRALDLMELNLGVPADDCVTALEIKSTYVMQRGIKDTFLTDYQYE